MPTLTRSPGIPCLLLALLGGAFPAPTASALDDLVSPNALIEARSLFDYLNSISGQSILSGQQEATAWDSINGNSNTNFEYILQNTGKVPVVRGYDYLFYLHSAGGRAGQNSSERAIQWARAGGVVTFACHWFTDIGSPAGNPQFYTPGANGNPTGTTFDIRQAVLTGTPENIEFLAKADLIASELKKLRDARVPVIWRPFHECGGTWFWWSAHGAEPFKQAYRLLFNRFTQVHGLTNLIWCFNPIDSTTIMQNWYPGDEVVDMITLDVYPTAGTHPTYAADSRRMRDFKSGRKVVAMSENGAIPDPDQFFADGAGWTYFCTWNGFENNVAQNSVAFLSRVFNHARVITLDEVPDVYHRFGEIPSLLFEPPSASTGRGARIVLSTLARGTAPLAYQWRKNGVDISGALAAELALDNVSTGDAGSYTVVVQNPVGSVTSQAATLAVTSSNYIAPGSTMINISTRAQVGTGGNIMIAGFVISGSGSKKVLIRAVGPGLAQYLPGTLADPKLELTTLSGTVLATNDDWGAVDAAAIAAGPGVALAVGSKDAAMIVTLPVGQYTALVKGVSDTTGLALVELYDLDQRSAARLINLSTRAQVGTGGTAMIAGFVVVGASPRNVLVRALGPTLSQWLPSTLPDPQLNLTSLSGTSLATNDNWDATNGAAIVAAATATGAYPLAAGTRDSALLIALPEGQYTPQITDHNGASGLALVEVYEAP